MSELPKDLRGKLKFSNLISKWLDRIFSRRADKSAEMGRIKQMAKECWIVVFFLLLFGVVLAYLLYDIRSPETAEFKAHRELSIAEMKKDAYLAGKEDGSAVVDALACKSVQEFDKDGKSIGTSSITCKIPKGTALGGIAGVDSSAQNLYLSGTESLMSEIWGWSKWLFMIAVLPLLVMNAAVEFFTRKREPGESWIPILRLVHRSRNQIGAIGAAGSTAGVANNNHGSMTITVVRPEDNPKRLSDFVGNEEVDDVLTAVIKAARAQRIEYEADVARAVATEKKKNSNASDQYLRTVAANVPVPPIPEGLYGGIQNTKFVLAGEPGTGKTLWPAVAAGESGLTLLTVGGEFERIFIGAGTQNVEALVAKAKDHAPCWVFLDEGEQAAQARSPGVGNGGANHDGSTTALLRAIDGIETKLGIGQSHGIHWILATNHVKKLDPAMVRSGRLKVLTFNKPTLANLKKLLKLFFGKKQKLPLAGDFKPENVATILLGKTGADIELLVNEYAVLAGEIHAQEKERLNARANAESKRLIANGISDVEEIEKHLETVGLSVLQIDKHLGELTFGQPEFIESLLRLLMGRKKTGRSETFAMVRDVAWHEGMHGLANAAMQWLNLLDWKVRFFTVGNRENTLGLMYPSADDDVSMMSVENILARAVVSYAGGFGQMIGHDDLKRFGDEIDLYRDSGTTGDNEQADEMIHQAITTFGGSLEIGQISKGKGGQTWFSELGRQSVDQIDRAVRVRQKLSQFLAWRVTSIFMQNEVVWDVFDEVLNSPERLILQERFYELFDKIMADSKTKRQIAALPGEYRRLAGNADRVLAWKPERQPFLARRFIRRKTNWLEARYIESRRREDLVRQELDNLKVPV